jgi:hypothetical protein
MAMAMAKHMWVKCTSQNPCVPAADILPYGMVTPHGYSDSAVLIASVNKTACGLLQQAATQLQSSEMLMPHVSNPGFE